MNFGRLINPIGIGRFNVNLVRSDLTVLCFSCLVIVMNVRKVFPSHESKTSDLPSFTHCSHADASLVSTPLILGERFHLEISGPPGTHGSAGPENKR